MESKRDDLLIPYFNLVKDKIQEKRGNGVPLKLGEFKGIMLDKLAAQGGLNNLSLGSNFYLAGATRYYFEGALTTDKQAHMLSGDPLEPDMWDVDTCRRLNACINVLRNAYIDTVGTTFEQPEDFGSLTLQKLLRKYNKKIKEELGESTPGEETQQDDGLDRGNRVGNGYTYEIIYNMAQAEKYKNATSPGSWCITYSDTNYNYYIRNYKVHYVIFVRDGYENVKREVGPGFTRQKPHDEYGNSMIAYLQYNNDWRAPIITSRWNHGHGDIHCEADNAYTVDEFCRITGITPEDLQRIYAIWNKDKSKYKSVGNDEIEKSELKARMLSIRRKLSYAQMVINYGEKLETALTNAGVSMENFRTEILFGNAEHPEKSVVQRQIVDNGHIFQFITDKNNIILDSIICPSYDSKIFKLKYETCPGVVILKGKNKFQLYNVKYHEFLKIDEKTTFKRAPFNSYGRTCYNTNEVIFFEIKNGRNDISLISTANLRPVKLPNGSCWFSNIKGSNESRDILCDELDSYSGPVIEIVFDMESGEKYFYNIFAKRFIEMPNLGENTEMTNYHQIENPKDYIPVIYDNLKGNSGYFAMCFSSFRDGRNRSWACTHPMLLNYNGEKVYIYGENKFSEISGIGNRFLLLGANDINNRTFNIYDPKFKKIIAIKDKPLVLETRYGSYLGGEDNRFLFIGISYTNLNYVYDTQTGLSVENTTKFRLSQDPLRFDVYSVEKAKIWVNELDKNNLFIKLRGESLTWDEAKRKFDIEIEKSLMSLYDMELTYVPNDLPVNDEHASGEDETELNEERIRNIVSESIRRVLYGGKK